MRDACHYEEAMLHAPARPPFVKVCGFTDPANLAAVCELNDRPDAVGLNFWSGSKRFLDAEARTADVHRLARMLPAWGVFVNADDEDLFEIPDVFRLRAIQFHGDEPPERLAEVRGFSTGQSIVRAWRAGESLDPLLAHVAAAGSVWRTDDRVLLDAAVPGAYGGTGTQLDWHALRAELDRVGDRLPPVILAGGLTPENVAEAVRVVRPWGVDVAGGVESGPGVKDPAKVAAFVAAAKGAFR